MSSGNLVSFGYDVLLWSERGAQGRFGFQAVGSGSTLLHSAPLHCGVGGQGCMFRFGNDTSPKTT